jgi:hypothetical protein
MSQFSCDIASSKSGSILLNGEMNSIGGTSVQHLFGIKTAGLHTE